MTMQVVHTTGEVRELVRQARQAGKRVGLVPTMGALHEGHLSLMRGARADTDFVVISIFVNPTQFRPGEDLEEYPRPLEEDTKRAREVGVDLLFAPDSQEMYPDGFVTYVEVTKLTEGLCGASRPGHFRGVTTVVTKLFNIVQPDAAYFGQKDAQQATVIKRLVKDLNMDIEVKVLPTVREVDGLALSSRNQYLSPAQRQAARILYQSLERAKTLVEEGERNSAKIIQAMREMIGSVPSAEIDYIAIVHPETMEEVARIEREVLVALAVHIGPARLIDNMLMKPD